MDADVKKLRKLAHFMRRQGVLRLKTSETELELSPAAFLLDEARPIPRGTPASADIPDDKGAPERTPEEIQLWSAPGVQPYDTEVN